MEARATEMGLLMRSAANIAIALTFSTVLCVKYGLGIVDEVASRVDIVR